MASYVQLGQSGKVYRDPPSGKKPPKKKKQNTQFAYILLGLVLVLGIGLMAGATIWLTDDNHAGGNNESDEPSIDVRYTGTRTSGTHPTVPPTTTTTATTVPTVSYVPGTSGSFISNNEYKVKLIAEYGMVKNASGQDELQLQLYLQSFSLTLGGRTGKITVNGKEHSFRSEEINIEENVRTKTLLATQVLDTSQKEITVDVTWHMGITYSGVEVEDLTVSGVIVLP